MSQTQTADQRLGDLETVVKTLITFNISALSVISRRVTEGNPEIANVIARELTDLKSLSYSGIDKELHDSYVDSLIVGITGKA